jgi:hypothetical protein
LAVGAVGEALPHERGDLPAVEELQKAEGAGQQVEGAPKKEEVVVLGERMVCAVQAAAAAFYQLEVGVLSSRSQSQVSS